MLPLHHRLYSSLLQQITDGMFLNGDRLPSEHELGASFNVSRATVRRALFRLEAEGLVSRKQGAGTFVRRSAEKRAEGMAPLTEHLGKQTVTYDSQSLKFAYVPTPSFLDGSPGGYGAVVLELVRVTLVGGQPVHLCTSYVPERFSRNVDQASLGSQAIVAVLRDQGIEVGEADLYIEAAAADEQQAQCLQVALGAPLIRGIHVSKAPDGSPLEHNTTLSRPDRFRYRFNSDERHGVISPVAGLITPPSG